MGPNSQCMITGSVVCGFGTAATWEMRRAKAEREMFRRVNIMLVAVGRLIVEHSPLNTKKRASAEILNMGG